MDPSIGAHGIYQPSELVRAPLAEAQAANDEADGKIPKGSQGVGGADRGHPCIEGSPYHLLPRDLRTVES